MMFRFVSLRALTCLFALLAAAGLEIISAQEEMKSASAVKPKDEQLEALKATALVVRIGAKVSAQKNVLWQSDQTRVTVHGLGVSLRLESDTLLIVSEITPYRQADDGLYILVQGQVWLKNNNTLQYYTNVKGINTKIGETVLFYPLGKAQEEQAVLALEIRVDPYKESP